MSARYGGRPEPSRTLASRIMMSNWAVFSAAGLSPVNMTVTSGAAITAPSFLTNGHKPYRNSCLFTSFTAILGLEIKGTLPQVHKPDEMLANCRSSFFFLTQLGQHRIVL